MHHEILTPAQIVLLPFVKLFRRNFILVGGTAIALHLGHRRSVDFDLFSNKALNPKLIFNKIFQKKLKIQKRIIQLETNYTMMIHGVQFTFYHYPFQLTAKTVFQDSCRIPSLLDLAAMKAHALGGRGKWKDYVDLYFILRDHYSLAQISDQAVKLFDGEFNQRLFREQISLFTDISYREKVEFLGEPIPEEKIKKFLTNVGTSR